MAMAGVDCGDIGRCDGCTSYAAEASHACIYMYGGGGERTVKSDWGGQGRLGG